MRSGWTPKLKHLLHAADPVLTHIAEVVTVQSEDIKDTVTEWAAADSTVGMETQNDGTIRLASTGAALIDQTSDNGTEVDGLTFEPTFAALLVEWGGSDPEEQELESLVARLHPRPDGGAAKEVVTWVAQLFRVSKWGPVDTQFEVEPISRAVEVAASGEAEGDVTFDFTDIFGSPKAGPPPEYDPDFGGTITTAPWTLIRIWAEDEDGAPAGNVAWMADSTIGATFSGSGFQVTHYNIADGGDPGGSVYTTGGNVFLLDSTGPSMPRFTLNKATYSSATVAFTAAGNRPQGLGVSGDHRIRVAGLEPGDSEIVAEIRAAGGGTWLTCADGDLVGVDNSSQGGEDLSSLSKATSYDMRATLNPSSSGFSRPTLKDLGVEELASTDLQGVVTVEGIRHRVDPRTLKGNITQATFRFLKTGEKDYRDYGSQILAANHIGDVEIRLWLGDPTGDYLDRSEWMLIDVFEIEDYENGDTAHIVQALSPLRRLRTRIPPFTVTSGNDGKREVVEYANQTITAVYADLIDSQVGLPARWRGQPVTDPTSVSKRIEDTDGKDEIDRVAYLAGHAVIASQGRVKGVRILTDEGDPGTPVAVFRIGDYTPLRIGPGFSSVVDEFHVPYGWDDARNDGRGEFEGEVRRFNAIATQRLGGASIQSTERLDDEIAKWVQSDTLADALAVRVLKHTGTGLMLWRIRPTYRHPHLEPGDPVVVVTDQFVGRAPRGDVEIRGPVAAKGIIMETSLRGPGSGEDFDVWIPSFDRLTPVSGDVTRVGYLRPRIFQAHISFDTDGGVLAKFQAADANSVKAVVNASAFQGKSTVRAQAAQATDGNGWVEIDLGGSFDLDDFAYISALAFENADGSGREQDDLWTLKIRRQESAFIVPEVVPKAWQDGGDAVLVLQARDPQSRLLDVRYKIHSGGGDYDFTDPEDGTWTAATTESLT